MSCVSSESCSGFWATSLVILGFSKFNNIWAKSIQHSQSRPHRKHGRRGGTTGAPLLPAPGGLACDAGDPGLNHSLPSWEQGEFLKHKTRHIFGGSLRLSCWSCSTFRPLNIHWAREVIKKYMWETLVSISAPTNKGETVYRDDTWQKLGFKVRSPISQLNGLINGQLAIRRRRVLVLIFPPKEGLPLVSHLLQKGLMAAYPAWGKMPSPAQNYVRSFMTEAGLELSPFL